MKKYTLFTRFVLPFFIGTLAVSLPVSAEEEDSPLTVAMDQTSGALKNLRRIAKDDWAAGAKEARIAADGIRKGMAFIPAILEAMPDGKDKAKALADYRMMMGLSYAAICELELAYLAEDQEKVDAASKKVKAGKKEGHKKYTDD